MWFLYLDESGDLGFDFDNKNPSRFFTITILALRTHTNNRSIINAVKKTLRRKITRKTKRKQTANELKGSGTSLDVKKYFFRQVSGIRFAIYALTLNKERLYPELQEKKEVTYNYISRLILDQIPFEHADISVDLIVDKRKTKRQVGEFNKYVTRELKERLGPSVRLNIHHLSSHQEYGLQAVDMFSHGVFAKYEREDTTWYDIFRGKVVWDDLYLPKK